MESQMHAHKKNYIKSSIITLDPFGLSTAPKTEKKPKREHKSEMDEASEKSYENWDTK
jgi:hypothetical protein